MNIKKWEIPHGILTITVTKGAHAILKVDEVEQIFAFDPKGNKTMVEEKIKKTVFKEIRNFLKEEILPDEVVNWIEFYQDKKDKKLPFRYYLAYIYEPYHIIISGEIGKKLSVYIECEEFNAKEEFRSLYHKFFNPKVDAEPGGKDVKQGFKLDDSKGRIKVRGAKRFRPTKEEKKEIHIIRADFKIKGAN